MTSMASDNESNVSAYISYDDRSITRLYMSAIENMKLINVDLEQVENNLKRIVSMSGPLEIQLNALLRTLPEPNLQFHMETE